MKIHEVGELPGGLGVVWEVKEVWEDFFSGRSERSERSERFFLDFEFREVTRGWGVLGI